jgi:hypothetical protein
MTKEITVSSSIDDSTKLQKLINSTGNTPAKYTFQGDELEINSLIRFYNHAECSGNGITFRLMENAPTNPFSEQVPLVGSKYINGTEGLNFHNIIFEGNRDIQNKVPKKNGKNWGLGYHNFIGLGSISSISFSNAVNCEFYNLEFNNSLGDGIRPEGGTNIKVHDIKGKRTGHDTINYSAVIGGEVYNVDLMLGVGSGVRMRSCQNVKIHDCKLDNSAGLTYGPGIQIQSTAKNWIGSDIEIYDNTILDTYGPGIQVAGSMPNNGLVDIHNNLFIRCGAMPESVNRPVLGGVAFAGFPVHIHNNTIVDSYGFGLVAGAYDVGSNYSYAATIERNIITGTRKAKKVGTASGTGIANLMGSRYSISCSENCLSGNLAEVYGVKNVNGISKDPLFVGKGDYHLKASSPCRLSGYQLGRYADTTTDDSTTQTPTSIFVHCTEDEAAEIVKKYNSNYIIYRSA